MTALHWKQTDWFAQHFIFSVEQDMIGKLDFYSAWNFNAVYEDKDTHLKFTRKNFWNANILITQDEALIGEIDFGFFGSESLILASGETYKLSSNLWGGDAKWKTESGEAIVTFKPSSWISMRKGIIKPVAYLPYDTAKLLMSSGVFMRLLRQKLLALTLGILIPVIVGSNQ